MLKARELFKIVSIPVFFASLCCFAPVVLVLFGLSTVAFAASLTDIFYGQYRWAFRAAGLVLLTVSTVIYLRRAKGICTLDDARRRRTEVINIILLVFIAGVLGYVFWLYVVVEIAGLWLGIWG